MATTPTEPLTTSVFAFNYIYRILLYKPYTITVRPAHLAQYLTGVYALWPVSQRRALLAETTAWLTGLSTDNTRPIVPATLPEPVKFLRVYDNGLGYTV